MSKLRYYSYQRIVIDLFGIFPPGIFFRSVECANFGHARLDPRQIVPP
jgi:hypothetical protein